MAFTTSNNVSNPCQRWLTLMAEDHQPVDWETCDTRDDYVQTSACKQYLSVRGPARRAGQPIVICESGGSQRGIGWSAVASQLESQVRVLYYDRAGIGYSGSSNLPRTAINAAAELAELLRTARIGPPYIVVSHTYGAIIAREFLHLSAPGDIVGMVFVDANQENTHTKIHIPFDAVSAVMADVDFLEVTRFNLEHKLTEEEYKAISPSNYSDSQKAVGEDEKKHLLTSCAALAEKKQLERQTLGDYPVTVIHGTSPTDWTKMLEAARGRNVGTPAQLAEVEAFVHRVHTFDEELQREILRLSKNGRFVQASTGGHNAQMTEPEMVANEILAVLRQVS